MLIYISRCENIIMTSGANSWNYKCL